MSKLKYLISMALTFTILRLFTTVIEAQALIRGLG